MTTLTYTGTLVITSCWCGIELAIPDSLYDQAHQTRKAVYCPLGHTFIYTDTEVDRLKRDLAYQKDRAAADRARADQAESSLRATKGHVTRLRKQVLFGECPFCGQHLRDLARHISRKHQEEQS